MFNTFSDGLFASERDFKILSIADTVNNVTTKITTGRVGDVMILLSVLFAFVLAYAMENKWTVNLFKDYDIDFLDLKEKMNRNQEESELARKKIAEAERSHTLSEQTSGFFSTLSEYGNPQKDIEKWEAYGFGKLISRDIYKENLTTDAKNRWNKVRKKLSDHLVDNTDLNEYKHSFLCRFTHTGQDNAEALFDQIQLDAYAKGLYYIDNIMRICHLIHLPLDNRDYWWAGIHALFQELTKHYFRMQLIFSETWDKGLKNKMTLPLWGSKEMNIDRPISGTIEFPTIENPLNSKWSFRLSKLPKIGGIKVLTDHYFVTYDNFVEMLEQQNDYIGNLVNHFITFDKYIRTFIALNQHDGGKVDTDLYGKQTTYGNLRSIHKKIKTGMVREGALFTVLAKEKEQKFYLGTIFANTGNTLKCTKKDLKNGVTDASNAIKHMKHELSFLPQFEFTNERNKTNIFHCTEDFLYTALEKQLIVQIP